VGQLVAAEVTLSSGTASTETDRAFVHFCHQQGLPEWMIPRLWTWRDTLPLAANFKARS
jgi:hypothetical protein